MHKTVFYSLGKRIVSLRWVIIGLWVCILLACLPFLPHIIAPFKTTGFVDDHSKSTQYEHYLNDKLGFSNNNNILILYSSKTLLATNPLFINKIKYSLSDLDRFPVHHEIILPEHHKNQISKNEHTAYVVVILKHNEPLSNASLVTFKSLLKPPSHMTMQLGGEPIFVDSVNKQTKIDLYKADFVGTPIAIITLILVFGSIVAGVLPIILGGGSALMILTTLYCLGHVFTLSIFTLNIALLLGLCLSLDYSLFIISRFRDELGQNETLTETIAVTQETAGKAIFFSGIAVFASLSALFIFPVNILFSVAVGGVIAVLVAMLTAIIVLPAILAVLNTRVNLLSVRWFRKNQQTHHNAWRWIAEKVVKRPFMFFIPILALLLMLGYPFLSAKFGISDFRIFPQHSESRQFYDTYAEKFNETELTPIQMLVMTKHRPILSRHNLSKLYDLAHTLKRYPFVEKVNSIVTIDPKLTKSQYYGLYVVHKELMTTSIKTLLDTTTRQYLTVISIISKYPVNSSQTKALINDLRQIKLKGNMSFELMGKPVSNLDVLETISHRLPYAILWIMVSTYLILIILLRSLFLPIKAIIMNLLSLSVCYGALVLVFQEGYLHQILNFQPQGMLDISLLVIIFCALFGFSMDYEVFLLTRIKESYELNHNNKQSIVFGIEKSSRIITSAALIVIFICGSFLVADVLMVKAFGLGIAVAIFVDAFLIRTFLVPATMTLLNQWNWYLPKWLDRILPRL